GRGKMRSRRPPACAYGPRDMTYMHVHVMTLIDVEPGASLVRRGMRALIAYVRSCFVN
uniref:Uncharacterized protein n=1 Tax=Aegilops tauschii subsp. strangulata TaxID=200361 RepID=A0A453RN74_AEGTS